MLPRFSELEQEADNRIRECRHNLMYCPYCGTTHDDETVIRSIEHVIPYGLGGSDDLTIITCDRSNNTLGSDVDAPFMDFFPVQCSRFFLGLKSVKGNEPTQIWAVGDGLTARKSPFLTRFLPGPGS